MSQRGSLKKVPRKDGETWVLRYRVKRADGKPVEATPLRVGLVRDLPDERDAWREVGVLGLLARINAPPAIGPVRFDALAEHYLKADFGEDTVRPKSENTAAIVEHVVRDYLIARWGNEVAEAIKPLDVQRWLKSLNAENHLAWTTISKMRGIMSRIYKVGILHGHVSKNPVQHVETCSTSTYRAIVIKPEQTLAILRALPNPLHKILVLICAATGLRASELVALRWSDILWDEGRIRVCKRWARGKDGETKTEASDGFVPLHAALADQLREWRRQSLRAKDEDFVFPSLKARGRVPLSAAVFVADHLRPAAVAAGVQIPEGHRFGLHNLRHSLSNWLVNKGKVDPKVVQGILRHSRVQTTLDLYTQQDSDETRGAQGAYLEALGVRPALVQ